MNKIGIVIDQLNVGGPEKIALEEVIALNQNGIPTDLVVLRRKGLVEDPFPSLMQKVTTVYLDDRLPSFLTKSFNIPGFYFFSLFHLTYPILLPFVVRAHEYRYFIVHGTYTSFTAITLKALRGISFSSFIWDPITYIIDKVYKARLNGLIYKFFRHTASFVDKLILHFSDSILTGGSAHNKILKELKPDVVIHSIPPGVQPAKEIQILHKKDYILLVTAWKEGKSPEFIFELLKANDYLKFYLVGKWIDESYKNKFTNMIKEMGYENNIKVVGAVSENVLNKYYQEALLLLQINNDKGFGMPALEATANGTTFIIPEGQGVCELFINKVHGYYTKEKDIMEISSLLKKLVENKKIVLNLSKEAYETTLKNYTWKTHARKIQEILLINESHNDKKDIS